MQSSPISQSSRPQPQPDTAITQRRYDLDWLRVIAIVTLLFYHTGMIYVSWGWHIKSNETSVFLETIMRWLHRWRMPLLFFISGASTFFGLKKRSFSRYAGERVRRLFVPLVFGMFVIVPPQIYYEWLSIGRFSGSYADFYPNVFGFEPYSDGGQGGAFSWHHLWFVLYLFLYSLLSIPVFAWLKSTGGQRFTNWFGRLIAQTGAAFWVGLGVMFIGQITLKPYFPDETHALINDWAYFVKNLLLFWFGYLLVSRQEFWQIITDQRQIFLVITAICTVAMYAITAVYDTEGPDVLAWEIAYLEATDGLTIASVLATIGYGYRYLNRNHLALPRLNETVYPFYILHQTVIVVIGYYVLKLDWGIWPGFFAVSLSALAICVALIVVVIRPFRLTRAVFGMK